MTTESDYQSELLDIAIDLVSELRAGQCFEHLLDASLNTIPCDAACVLKLEDHVLYPVAQRGLRREALGRRFQLAAHPRLDSIVSNDGVTRFDDDSALPDPYDGLVEGVEGNLPVHSCMGARLQVKGETWGVITFDALSNNAFCDISDALVASFARLAAASAAAADYVYTLEQSASREHEINQNLLQQVMSPGSRDLIGNSEQMNSLRREIALVASSDLAVLISGETGTGKELVARAVHSQSDRRDQPIVYLNCAALPEQLIESELFGYRKGAFTGADRNYRGRFELAHRGTLFLDEIGEMPLGAQAKLLRVLQSGEVQPLGSEESMLVDVRIIAATNRDLKHETLQKRFREDLFHRLSVYPIRVPPLREHARDITLLAGHFIEMLCPKMGLAAVTMSDAAVLALQQYQWAGNVRELEHVISRALLGVKQRAPGGQVMIELVDLLGFGTAGKPEASDLPTQDEEEADLPMDTLVDSYQRQLINERVRKCDGNWSRAAESLGVHRSNLHRLAKRLGLKS